MKMRDEYISPRRLNILLADDDKDDCQFFKEALEELQLHTRLTVVHDGEELLQLLQKKTNKIPHVLFLDVNMPRKNGSACLEEIKRNPNLKTLPVIILSTSYDEHIGDLLYEKGAQYYIGKPADFSELKKVIQQAISLVTQSHGKRSCITQPPREKFLLNNLKSIFL